MRFLAVIVMLVAVMVAGDGATAQGQNSCDDPFSGGRPPFTVSYWELTDFCKTSIAFSSLRSGGPPPDGIPPIDNPQFESIESAREWLFDQSPVIAVELDGDARAYPLGILTWHEIVNDTLGDTPVAVTFCPLCNAGIVFVRRVDNDTIRLGVSGLLRNSDMVMWDDLTQSFWQQISGTGIVGEYTGVVLDQLPSQMTSLGAFAEAYPDGVVLSRDTGEVRSYGVNPYRGYDTASAPFLYDGPMDDRLSAFERVLAVRIGTTLKAYPFSVLSTVGLVNDELGAIPVLALWQPGATSALDAGVIDESRDVGMAALYDRELDGIVLTFERHDDGVIRDLETGSGWNFFGQAVDGELAGQQLKQMLAAPHFWFAWAAFYPETEVYGIE
jgi:hypothetical protein